MTVTTLPLLYCADMASRKRRRGEDSADQHQVTDNTAATATPSSSLGLLCSACSEPMRSHIVTTADGKQEDHRPYTLSPCGHTACGLCIHAMTSSATPRCTYCGVAAVMPSEHNSGLAALAESMIGLADDAQLLSPCADCVVLGDDEPATSTHRCNTCEKSVCESHVTRHQQKRHVMVELASTSQSHVAAPRQPSAEPTCPAHPNKPAKLYCVTCNVTVICDECVRLWHSDGDHDVKAALDTTTLLLSRLQDHSAVFAAAADTLQSRVPVVSRTISALTAAGDAATQYMTAAEAKLMEAVDVSLKRARSEVKSVVYKRKKALECQSDGLLVSASQCGAAAAMCGSGAASRNAVAVAEALTSADALMALTDTCKGFEDPSEEAYLEVDIDTECVVDALSHAVRVRMVSLWMCCGR